MWKSVWNTCQHLLRREPRGWYPLISVYYLTYACEFQCPYCSDGAGIPYPKLRSPVLRGEQLNQILVRLRKACDHLVVTGGEPTKHPEFESFLQRLPAHRFKSVVLTTIGHEIEPYLTTIAKTVNFLVFSLDTLDSAKGDAWLGRGPGVHAGILATIEKAVSMPGRKYEILISTVATPDNLDDLRAVFAYTQARGIRHAVCPVLRGVIPDPALAKDPRYAAFFDLMIAEKRKGAKVNGTLAYLQWMRDLALFRCRPSTVVAVAPNGDVFYPCLEKGTTAGNLLVEPNLHRLRRQGIERHGPTPQCGPQCHSACVLAFATALNRPWSLLPEIGLEMKNRFRRQPYRLS